MSRKRKGARIKHVSKVAPRRYRFDPQLDLINSRKSTRLRYLELRRSKRQKNTSDKRMSLTPSDMQLERRPGWETSNKLDYKTFRGESQ